MTRRTVALLFILAMLILPQTSGALPREVCTSSDSTATCTGFQENRAGGGYATVQTLTVPADGSNVFTTGLTQGIQYQFRVSGTWRYDSIATHQADAAFSTSDGWSSASKAANGRSLEIEGIRQSNNASLAYSSAHTYAINRAAETNGSVKLRIFDENYADGNSGALTVEILRQQRVAYTGTINAPVGLATINLERRVLISSSTVTSPVPVNIPVGPYDVPRVPVLVTLKGAPNGNSYCFTINNSTTGDLPPGGICLPNLINQRDGFGVPIFPVEPFQVCAAGSCDQKVQPVTVPEIAIGPMAIPDDAWRQYLSWVPGTGGERPFKPGSSIQFIIEWEADRDHLYSAASGPGGQNQNGAYQPFDMTSPSEINWYLSNRDRLSAKIKMVILFPDGQFGPPDGSPDPTYFPNEQGIKIPGLGQFIEASFSSRVAGR